MTSFPTPDGCGGRIRTAAVELMRLLPYRWATPQWPVKPDSNRQCAPRDGVTDRRPFPQDVSPMLRGLDSNQHVLGRLSNSQVRLPFRHLGMIVDPVGIEPPHSACKTPSPGLGTCGPMARPRGVEPPLTGFVDRCLSAWRRAYMLGTRGVEPRASGFQPDAEPLQLHPVRNGQGSNLGHRSGEHRLSFQRTWGNRPDSNRLRSASRADAARTLASVTTKTTRGPATRRSPRESTGVSVRQLMIPRCLAGSRRSSRTS